MNIISSVGNGFTKAIDYVVEKNRKIALINRVKLVIRNEEDNSQRAYIALGKYYFRNLRDKQNEETEHYCSAIENANKRRDRALLKLDDLTAPEMEHQCCEDDMCDESCDCCDDTCYDEELDKLEGIEGNIEDELEKSTPNVLHPELLWRGDEETNKDEAADETYSKTIPIDGNNPV